MDAGALGDVSALDDRAIVQGAAHFPIERVLIVRHFPNEGEGLVVVTVYTKDGEVVTSFSAAPGRPVTRPGVGVAQGTLRSIGAVKEANSSFNPEALDQYERSYLCFDDRGDDSWGGAGVGWSNPRLGKHGRPLRPPEFFETVGRPDLAEAYQRNQAIRYGMIWGGAALFVGGLVYMLVATTEQAAESGSYAGSYYDEPADRDAVPLIAGTSMMGIGTTLALIGLALDPHPVSPVVARELADQYNKALRSKLGLDQLRAVRSGLTLLPGGASIAISGSF